MLPLISFETGRKTQTQSSGQQTSAAPANGSLVLSLGTTAERPTHAARNQKNYTRAPPKRVGRAFALLTKTHHGSHLTGQLPSLVFFLLLGRIVAKYGLKLAKAGRFEVFLFEHSHFLRFGTI